MEMHFCPSPKHPHLYRNLTYRIRALSPSDWLASSTAFLEQEIKRLEILKDPDKAWSISCLQLADIHQREQNLTNILGKRCAATLPSFGDRWQDLLIDSVKEGGHQIDLADARHAAALQEQADALERITTRKLATLVGRAGTGKTTVLGALLKSGDIRKRWHSLSRPHRKSESATVSKGKCGQ